MTWDMYLGLVVFLEAQHYRRNLKKAAKPVNRAKAYAWELRRGEKK